MGKRIETANLTASGASIIVPPGIALKPVVRGRLYVGSEDIGGLEGHQEVLVTFRIEYSESTGSFQVAKFGVDREDNSLEVSGAFFRTVRVHSIANAGILAALPAWAFQLVQLRHLRYRGGLRSFPDFAPSDDEALLLTGLIYRIAEVSGDNPALAVADAIGLKQRTATNWIQRARVAGYMTSTEHGAAARRLAKTIAPFWSRFGREEWEAHLAAAGITQDDVRAIVEREILRTSQAKDGGEPDGND